jgi:hypothetical protein
MPQQTQSARLDVIRIGPRQDKRELSYDESVDEPAKLIADEPVEVEAEIPAEENEPVERIDEDDRFEPPMFDE